MRCPGGRTDHAEQSGVTVRPLRARTVGPLTGAFFYLLWGCVECGRTGRRSIASTLSRPTAYLSPFPDRRGSVADVPRPSSRGWVRRDRGISASFVPLDRSGMGADRRRDPHRAHDPLVEREARPPAAGRSGSFRVLHRVARPRRGAGSMDLCGLWMEGAGREPVLPTMWKGDGPPSDGSWYDPDRSPGDLRGDPRWASRSPW